MIKTTYQTPELRDANDNVVQEGSFGKNTALANSTNDGWIDYVMNDLEALHDTIGDSAPTLDGNGHVVEPANLAIGDEDGLRIKNNYLKLSGGNVTGIASFRTDLRMLDNQDNRFGGLYVPASSSTQQYMQFYSGTRATGDARLTLYPSGDGHFSLLAYSNNGSNSYELQSDNAGNLNWRGYPLAWKKDYLPLAGGTMTGTITSTVEYKMLANNIDVTGSTQTEASVMTFRGKNDVDLGNIIMSGSLTRTWIGIRGRNAALTAAGTNNWGDLRLVVDSNATWRVEAVNNPNLTYSPVANSNSIPTTRWTDAKYLPLSGGTMTGNLATANSEFLRRTTNDSYLRFMGGLSATEGASLVCFGKDHPAQPGEFTLRARDSSNVKDLYGKPDGSLTWQDNQLGLQANTNNFLQMSNGQSYTFTFTSNIVTIIARRGSNCAMYVVDVWDTGAVKLAGTGNEPISVGHEANSHECTITNINGNAVVVQIIHSNIGW